jgi:hypothetical protein
VTPGWSYLCGNCTAETTQPRKPRRVAQPAVVTVLADRPPPPLATISGLAARVGVLTGLVLLLNLAVIPLFARSLVWLGEADGLVLGTAGAFMGWAGIAGHGKDTP